MAILGVIADDFTGATDIAGMLVKGGMRTIQTIGVPGRGAIPDDVDAVVVALKSRSIAAAKAVVQSLDALKICSRRAASASSSSTARPSIRPTPAISVRSATRCSTR